MNLEKRKKEKKKDREQGGLVEEVRPLEAQVMAGGEGLQANQVDGDRCPGRR